MINFEYPNSAEKQIDTGLLRVIRKKVKSLESQEPIESRKVWSQVTQSLQRGDIESATHYKNIIEKQQRSNEKLRKEKKIEYASRYFFKSKSNPDYVQRQLLNSDESTDSSLSNDPNIKFQWFHKSWFG